MTKYILTLICGLFLCACGGTVTGSSGIPDEPTDYDGGITPLPPEETGGSSSGGKPSTGGFRATGGNHSTGGATVSTGGAPPVIDSSVSSGGSLGAGGSTETDAGATVIIQCPTSIPAAECNNGTGWAHCDLQPLHDIPRSVLIKGSGSAVYWYAQDGSRYVFPNEKTLHSWFPVGGDCPVIFDLSDTDLSSIKHSGNVTVKPGSYLIKITSDPRVYAVSCGGILHWIESETLLNQIYQWNWHDYVIDIADSFSANYALGTSISDASQYDPYYELGATLTPDDNLNCPSP